MPLFQPLMDKVNSVGKVQPELPDAAATEKE
jgi:hypothetical protein